MPRKRGIRQSFTFNKGWNTEASPMTFPENTAKDLDNVILDVDGSIRRRMGVVCDSATSTRYFQKTKSQYEYPAIGFWKWENVAGSGNLSVLVTQYGTTLQINGEDGTNYGQVDFSGQVVPARASSAPNEVITTASGMGYFFCAGPSINPFYLVADIASASASLVSIDINIRDFDGADEAVDVDNRPTTLTAAHEYNLRNQGWPTTFQCIDDASAKSDADPIQFTFDKLGVYPSNADVIYYGKQSTGTDESEIDRYNPYTMSKAVFGTTPAPRGKYIYNPFYIDRDGYVAGAGTEQVMNRPRAICFHNGRVFYAGVNAEGYTGKVYYSQQLTDIKKVGYCYQEQDPTAEDFNELLATDGGEIDIPNCGNILRVEEGPAGVIIFASNGMWEITGQEGKFSATEFYVRKVTDIGCVGPETVVNADGTFFYWSDAGIVGTQQDKVTGNLSADVITQTSIQLGYLLFGGPQRRGARGVWIRGEKKVVWLYSTDSTYDNVSDRFKYNGVLVLDTILGAFYKYSISDFNVGEAPYVSGIVESSNTVTTTVQENVTAGGVDVTASGVDVTVGVAGADADTLTSTWRLQVVRPTAVGTNVAWGIDFATFASRTFTDWYFEDNAGANYTSYLETGYDYGGEAMFEKRPTYVYTYMSRVSKSNATGGFYNIPDPTETAVVPEPACLVYTGSILSKDASQELDTSSTSRAYTAFEFNADGTEIYAFHSGVLPVEVYKYTLATPYNPSTALTVGGTLLDNTTNLFGISQVYGVQFANSGQHVVTVNGNTSDVDVFALSTPYDLTTATQVGSTFATTCEVAIMKDDGTRLITQNGSGLTEYTMTAYDPSTAVATGSTYNLGTGGGASDADGFDMSDDGLYGYAYFGDTATATDRGIKTYTFGTAWDLSTISLSGFYNDSVLGSAGGELRLVEDSNGNQKLVQHDYSNDIFFVYVPDCDLCGTVCTLSDTGETSVDMTTIMSGAGFNRFLGLMIKEDGTKAIGIYDNFSTKQLAELTLSTPFDFSTAVLTNTLNVNGINNQSRGCVYIDGNHMYTYDAGASTGTTVYYAPDIWDLSGYDISTPNTATTYYKGGGGSSFSIHIDPTAGLTRAWSMSINTGVITEGTLSGDYQVNTFSAGATTLATGVTGAYRIAWQDAGSTLLVFAVGQIRTYTCSTAYDVSTATLDCTASSLGGGSAQDFEITDQNRSFDNVYGVQVDQFIFTNYYSC